MVLDVLVHVSEDLGVALVVSTHDPLIAQRLPMQWVMRGGRLISDQASRVA
jgi:putative ABC transport system ATP-binding protein